jgi:excisionase family DNA binding protein
VADVSQSDTSLIGTTEAAELLGWSRAKVKREAASGRLPFAQKMPGGTGAYLFHRSILEVVNRQKVSA